MSGPPERCDFADNEGRRCGRVMGHDPAAIPHVLVDAEGNPGPAVIPCEECGKRPADVGPYRGNRPKSLAVQHGYICRPCLLMLSIASKTCPPRFTDDPRRLGDQAEGAMDRSYRQAHRAEWAAERSRELAEATGGDLALLRELAEAMPNRRWLFGLLEPEVAEQVNALRNAAVRTWAKAAESREASNKLRFRKFVAEKGIVDLDNPFEDPEFLGRVLAGGDSP